MSEIPTYPNDEEYDQARDSAIASAARREERARILQVLAVMRQDVQRVLDLALKSVSENGCDKLCERLCPYCGWPKNDARCQAAHP